MSALAQQLLESDEPHAVLRSAGRLNVGVVRDQVRAERGEPLSDELPDLAEADDADGLVEDLDAGELRPLPLTRLQRGVRDRSAAGDREQQRDRLLGGADDVRLRRVDHHDAGVGRGLHVDVVETDAGARDDLQVRCRGDGLGVDLRGAADDDGVGRGERGQQRCAVGAVDLTDLEVAAQQVDARWGEFFGDQNNGLAHSWAILRRKTRIGMLGSSALATTL